MIYIYNIEKEEVSIQREEVLIIAACKQTSTTYNIVSLLQMAYYILLLKGVHNIQGLFVDLVRIYKSYNKDELKTPNI